MHSLGVCPFVQICCREPPILVSKKLSGRISELILSLSALVLIGIPEIVVFRFTEVSVYAFVLFSRVSYFFAVISVECHSFVRDPHLSHSWPH